MMYSIKSTARSVVRWLQFAGTKYYCPLCRRGARLFTPAPRAPGQEVGEKYNIVPAGGRAHYRCPWCNSSDRERLVFAYLQKKTDILTTDRKISVLHIAPEKNMGRILKSRPNITYTSGDKFEGDARYKDGRYIDAMNLDITALPFENAMFDVIICNHVLEHVLDDRKGMAELYRTLTPGGFAILQVPVSRTIPHTIEDASATSPQQRLATFGQADHVRIYAEADYLARLNESGFKVNMLAPKEFLEEDEIERFGVNPEEKIYLGFK